MIESNWPAAWFVILAICVCLGALALDGCASDPRATPPDCRGVSWCFN